MTGLLAPETSSVSPELLGALVHRAGRADFPRFEAQLRSSGFCARPVRLRGEVQVCEGHGRRRTVWSTDGEPDGILRKACGNRREAVCPSCAERYRGDAYQLIVAGLRGGKGVPDTVVEHPAVFVTFTAPSFGPVHARALDPGGEPRRCRPRRDAAVCEHGVRLSCGQVHDEDDPCLGEPICPDCFDYSGAVIWNNVLGELWRRTVPVYLPRVLARQIDVTQSHLRELVRAAYVRVAEYQRRGLVHLHAVIRLDRAMPDYRADQLRPPDQRFTPALLDDAVRGTVAEVSAPIPDELGGGRVQWGEQLDVRHLDPARGARSPGTWPSTRPRAPNKPAGCCNAPTPARSTAPRCANTSAAICARRSRSIGRRGRRSRTRSPTARCLSGRRPRPPATRISSRAASAGP